MASYELDRKLTVLFIFHDTDYYSGATRSLMDILDTYIFNKTLNIVALFPKKQGTAVDYLSKKNIPIITSYYTGVAASINESWIKTKVAFPFRLLRFMLSIYRTYRLKDVLKEAKIDVVYSNTSVIFVGGFINKFFHIPHIWHMREFRREDHEIDFFLGKTYFHRFANKYANLIVVISNSMYRKHVGKISARKLRVSYNDISPKYINPKTAFNLEQPTLQLLITGGLSASKGQIEVLQALKILIDKGYNMTLNIAGSTNGRYYQVLAQYVQEQQLQNHVVFHGLVKDMNELRNSMDIGIVASKNEAFGRVTIEGMLSCLAMIGRDSAGTSELIKDMKTGLLYQPDNLDSLVDKLDYLYHNRSEIERLGTNGFQYAVDGFTVGKCSESVLKLMQEVVNPGQGQKFQSARERWEKIV
ncbi:MAG TPA: glycosyltransferase family 4 protein [Desulfosporosinus sp.]|nr:glycosyltransferase family 4 protein [Desulfosporosinus sp.]